MAGAVSSAGLSLDQSFAVSARLSQGLSSAVSARLSPDQSFAVRTALFSQGRMGMGMGVRSIFAGIGSHRMATTGVRVILIPVMAITTERYWVGVSRTGPRRLRPE